MEEKKTALGDSVQRFYEACRISSRYDDLKAILGDIADCLESGDAYDIREIEKIRADFSSLIPVDESDRSIKHIIRWCLKHNYLQQGVTMTAEWFPRYAVAANVVKIDDDTVKEENEHARQPWDTWTGHLFKNYNPYETTVEDVNGYDLDNLTAKSLRVLIRGYDYNCWEIYKLVQGHNKKLETFLSNLMKVSLANPGGKFGSFLVMLKDKDPLKIVCNTKYNNPGLFYLQKYIDKGMTGAKNPASFILDMVATIKADVLVGLFDLQEESKKRTAKSDDDAKAKIAVRQNVFRKLLDAKRISTRDEEKFLELVSRHLTIVEFYRNRMNHGVIEFKGIEGNCKIVEDVEELLKLAEALEAE